MGVSIKLVASKFNISLMANIEKLPPYFFLSISVSVCKWPFGTRCFQSGHFLFFSHCNWLFPVVVHYPDILWGAKKRLKCRWLLSVSHKDRSDFLVYKQWKCVLAYKNHFLCLYFPRNSIIIGVIHDFCGVLPCFF